MMSKQQAIEWMAAAMGDGFGGEESFRVNTETGEIVVWMNDTTNEEGYTRLSFTLATMGVATFDEFMREYVGGEK